MRKIISIMTMIVLLLTITAPMALAANTTVTTTNTTSYFDTYNSTTKVWNELLTAKHRATVNGASRVVYCIQHKKSSPNSVPYNLSDVLSNYSDKAAKGMQIILDNGYPRYNNGLTNEAAEYATANALRFWLSECGDDQFYNQTNLKTFTDAQLRTGAAAGLLKDKIRVRNNSYVPVLHFSVELLIMARAQTVFVPQLDAPNMTAAHSSGRFVGTTKVTHNGLRGQYEVDSSALPSGSTVTGRTGASGDTLTVSIPASATTSNKTYSLILKGYDDRVRGNLQALNHANNSNYQRVLVAILSNMEVTTKTVTVTTGTIPPPSLPDLVISELKTDKATYNPGETVTVTATMKNIGTANAAACKVSLAVTGQTTQVKDGAALAVGASTNITYTFTAPSSTVNQTLTLTAMADSTNVVVESDETNNTRTMTVSVNAALPDLVIAALSTDKSNYNAGETITVKATVRNIGVANAGACKTSLTMTGQTTQVKDCVALAVGATMEITFTFTAPTSTTAQTLTYMATADSTNVVVESDETNNSRTGTLTVNGALPDLIVSALTPNKQTYSGGETITVTATISNIDANTAGACKVSLSGTNGLTTQVKDIGALNVGASTTVSFTFTAPQLASQQTITFTAMADSTNVVVESNENNNTRTTTAIVYATLPDIAVTNVQPGKAVYYANETVTIIATIENLTTIDVGSFIVSFTVDGKTYTATVPGLAGKAKRDVQITYIAPIIPAIKDYPITVVADSTNVIQESNKANNTKTGTVRIYAELPDLTITSMKSSKPSYRAGETVTITAVVANIGIINCPASEIQLTDEDGKEIQVLSVPALGANNATHTATFSFTAPTIPSDKTKTYTAFVDHLNKIAEKREDNNKASLKVEILAALPDLTVTKISSDRAKYTEGEKGTITVSVANIGHTGVSDSKLRLELDDFFDQVKQTGKIGVNETVEVTFTFIAPETVDVRSILATATADPKNEIVESDKTNNVLTAKLSVHPMLPDLVIVDSNAQAYYAGYDVVVMAVVENLTKTSVPDVKIRLELSGVGTATYDARICVPGNITNIVVFRIKVPDDPGQLTLKFTADPDNEIVEERKDNNTYTRTIEVVRAPDPMVLDPDVGDIEDVFWNNLFFELPSLLNRPEGVSRVEWTEYRYIGGKYVLKDFFAQLLMTFEVAPDPRIAYPDSITMESGFGIVAHAETKLFTNYDAPEKLIAPQMIWLTYPEFGYARDVYHSVFDSLIPKQGTPGAQCEWEYGPNPLSERGSRLHFTPLWFPDGIYIVSGQLFYAWAPTGQMYDFKESMVEIQGSMYDRVGAVQGRELWP